MTPETTKLGSKTELPPYNDEVWLCGVCKKPFDDPKTFPCLHSACSGCLEKLSFENSSAKNNCRCPLCKETFSYEDVLNSPSNYFLRNALEYLYVFSDHGSVKICTFCVLSKLETQASHVCVTCKDLLCTECSKHHSRTRQTVNHKVLLLSDAYTERFMNEIRDHQTVPCSNSSHRDHAECFCDTCNSLVCKECIVLEHNDHKLSDIRVRATLQRREIGTLMTRSGFLYHGTHAKLKNITSEKQKTVKLKNELLRKIEKAKENYIREISTQAESAKGKVCLLFSDHLSHFFSTENYVTGKLEKLEHSLKLSEILVTCGNDVEVAAFGNQLLVHLQELESKSDLPKETSWPTEAEIHVDLIETIPSLFRVENNTRPWQQSYVQAHYNATSALPNYAFNSSASMVRYQGTPIVQQPIPHLPSFSPVSANPPVYRPFPNIVYPQFNVGARNTPMTNQRFLYNATGPTHINYDQAAQNFLRYWNQNSSDLHTNPAIDVISPRVNNQSSTRNEESYSCQTINDSKLKQMEECQNRSSMKGPCLTTSKTEDASESSSPLFQETLNSICPNESKIESKRKLSEVFLNSEGMQESEQGQHYVKCEVSVEDDKEDSSDFIHQSRKQYQLQTEPGNMQQLSRRRNQEVHSARNVIETSEDTISESLKPTETLTLTSKNEPNVNAAEKKARNEASLAISACSTSDVPTTDVSVSDNLNNMTEFQKLELTFITDCQLKKESNVPSISDVCWVTSKTIVVSDSRNEVAKVYSIDGQIIFTMECPRINHVAFMDGIIACSCATKMHLYDKDNKGSRCIINYPPSSKKTRPITQGLKLKSVILINNKDAYLKEYSSSGRFIDGLILSKHVSPVWMTKLLNNKICVIDEHGALLSIDSKGKVKVLYTHPDGDWKPASITADCNDDIYVLNLKNSTVLKFSKTGMLLEAKQLPIKSGKGLCVNEEGNFITSDSSGKVFQFKWCEC